MPQIYCDAISAVQQAMNGYNPTSSATVGMTAIPVFSWNLVAIVGTLSSKRSNRNKDVKGSAEDVPPLTLFIYVVS